VVYDYDVKALKQAHQPFKDLIFDFYEFLEFGRKVNDGILKARTEN